MIPDCSDTVPLNVLRTGESGPGIVLLHGLLGSSRNWRHIAAELAASCRVVAPDFRNHGASPHTGPFTMDELACDVMSLLEKNQEGGMVTLVGHSLGGKVAMKVACRRPERVRRLVIVDISSEPAPRHWAPIFQTMLELDLKSVQRRLDAEDYFESKGIRDWAFRKFLSSNLEQKDGVWRWKVGLNAIAESSLGIVEPALEPEERFDGPTLLIRGGKSDYAPLKDMPAMRRHFPSLRVETVSDAGHNVHIDTPRSFMDLLRGFLNA